MAAAQLRRAAAGTSLAVEPDDSFDAVIRAAHRWCGDDMYDAIYALPRDVMRVCFSVRFTGSVHRTPGGSVQRVT